MSIDFKRLLHNEHRDVLLLPLTLILSSLALRADATIIPMVSLLSVLLFYSSFVFRQNQPFRTLRIISLWIALSTGTALSRLNASTHALSTVALSLMLLFASSMLISSFTVSFLFICVRLSTRLSSPWTQITIVPAIWATLWSAIAHINPVGYIATWSIANNADPYNWLVPVLGPASRDWVIAAWSVICSNVIGTWYIGPQQDDEDLLTMDPVTEPPPKQRCARTSQLNLAALLALLVIPSLFFDNLPLPVSEIDEVTPLSVACILPTLDHYKNHDLTFDDFLAESKIIRATARVLLWPEGAVIFHNSTERDEGFKRVRTELPGAYVGISYEETVDDHNDRSGKTAVRYTSLAVISQWSDEPHFVYRKRHLVPVAESFGLQYSSSPPSTFLAEIPRPNWVPKSKWAPAPSYTRPLPMTASICLDFAHPAPFSELNIQPALVLAPARTWDRTVGYTMWLQAKARAEELGASLLWCDGGAGGVSGVVGKGLNDVAQTGQGSFTRTISFNYPFSGRRTMYAKFGNVGLCTLWLLAFLPFAFTGFQRMRSKAVGITALKHFLERRNNQNGDSTNQPTPNYLE